MGCPLGIRFKVLWTLTDCKRKGATMNKRKHLLACGILAVTLAMTACGTQSNPTTEVKIENEK